MTTRQILIAGAFLPIDGDSYDGFLEKLITMPKLKGNTELIIVNRDYDSDAMEDHPVYLAWDHFDFPKEETMLSAPMISHLRRVINKGESLKASMLTEHEELFQFLGVEPGDVGVGLYTDYFDMDHMFDIHY